MNFTRVLLISSALATSQAALAQNASDAWRSTVESPTNAAAPVNMALVINEDGHSLRIYKDESDIVRGIFTLGNDLDRFENGSCPTLRVDRLPPHAFVSFDGPCQLKNPSVRFTLGVINQGEVQSTALWQLMNGSSFRVWFHVEGRGYREAVFSLKRSMNALVGAIGSEIEVVP